MSKISSDSKVANSKWLAVMLVGFFACLLMKLFEDYLPDAVIIFGFPAGAILIGLGLHMFSREVKSNDEKL